MAPSFPHLSRHLSRHDLLDGDELFVSDVSAMLYGTETQMPVPGIKHPGTTMPPEAIEVVTYTVSDGNGGTDTAHVTITFLNALRAAGAGTAAATAGPVTAPEEEFSLASNAALAGLMDEARQRWQAAGLSARALSRLDTAQVRVVNLHGALLAASFGNTILIDHDAAGFGWFIDATPGDDREFYNVTDTELAARCRGEAYGRMDLLTAVMHEMGHVLGIEHSDDSHDLMAEPLAAGRRRLPSEPDLLLAAFTLSGEIRQKGADLFFSEISHE